MKKFLKSVLLYICVFIYGTVIAFSSLLLIEIKNISWICILSLIILVFIAFPIVIYVKSKRFKNYIKRNKNRISTMLSMVCSMFLVLLEKNGIISMKNPIFWNWVIGILFAISLTLAIIFMIEYYKIKDDNLKLQIEPHTIRNAIESIRLKIKEISKDINGRMSDSQEDSALKSKINSLRYEMESTCDFLAEIAEDNSHEKNMSTIYDELENVKKYLEFKTNGNLWNVSFDVRLAENKKDKKDNIFEIPSRITTPMIENAFKHGDVNAPDFLSISFVQDEDKYMIEIRNRILQDGVRQTRRGGLGIQNMKRRIELYSENIGSSNIALLDNGTDGDYYYSKLTFQNTRE